MEKLEFRKSGFVKLSHWRGTELVKHFLVSESHVQLNRSVKLDGILFQFVIRSFGGDFRLAESGFDLRIHDSVLY